MRLVTVDLRWWDTHVKGFESLRLGFLERWDRAYTALIDDLEARGLLEQRPAGAGIAQRQTD